MEQYFRIVLWMFFLIFPEHLQARPVCPSLNINYLQTVQCGHNVTFTSPTNVQTHCLTAALESFKQGLEYAKSNCGYEDKEERIADTLEAFEHCDKNKLFPQNNQMNSTECTWEEEGSRKQFADFVQDFKNFSKLLNTVATE